MDIITPSGIAGFKIRYGNISDFNLPLFNDKDWSIKIYNGDNPPLKIDFVITKQESQTIIAYLQAGKNYHLLMHNSAAQKAVYDLQQFADSIPAKQPQIKIVSFEKISSNSVKNKMVISPVWLWALIITVLITLGFITYKLIKEIANKKTGE